MRQILDVARGLVVSAASAVLGLGLLGATLVALPVQAQKGEQKAPDWLSKLEPRTRTIQLCSLAGLNAFARDKTLRPKADRVVINASGEPKIDPTLVTGSGGAVRSGNRWFTFTFKCSLTANGMKTAGFSYELGREIPKTQWEKLGLWD